MGLVDERDLVPGKKQEPKEQKQEEGYVNPVKLMERRLSPEEVSGRLEKAFKLCAEVYDNVKRRIRESGKSHLRAVDFGKKFLEVYSERMVEESNKSDSYKDKMGFKRLAGLLEEEAKILCISR